MVVFPVVSIARHAWAGLHPHIASAIMLLSNCTPSKHIFIVPSLREYHFSEILLVKYDYMYITSNISEKSKLLEQNPRIHDRISYQ